jgi:DNA-directed RNA polymerase subunit omega
MLNALRSDDIVDKVGGRFKLAALIQRRWLELMQGARPMIDPKGMTPIEIVIEEILQDKIAIDYNASQIATPQERHA